MLSERGYWRPWTPDGRSLACFSADVLDGAYRVEHPTTADLERCVELQRIYADLRGGHRCLLVAVERLGEPKLATLDHRHFGTMRPRHVEAVELLPSNRASGS